jgi:rod shape-determining protein MreC
VATVNEVIHDSGQPFAIVRAIPTAALNRSRYMLLVFSDRRSPEQRATDAAIAQEEADRKGNAPAGQPAATGEQAAPAVPATPAAPATPPAQSAAPAAAPVTPAAPAHTRRQ